MTEISCGVTTIDARLAALLTEGFTLVLLGRPFTLTLAFVGEVQVAPRGAAFGFCGRARLSAPFEGETEVDLEIDAEGEHRLRFTVRDLAGALDRHVVRSLTPAERGSYDALVRPYTDRMRDCAAVLASYAGQEVPRGPVVAGINFFAEPRLADVEPTRALVRSFPQARLEERRLPLRLACTDGPGLRFEISGAAEPAAALGTAAVVLDRVALRVDEHTTAIASSATTTFTVRAGGETLACAGPLVVREARALLTGRLTTNAGTWKDPYGATGLTIGGTEVVVTPTTTAPFVELGVRGDVRVGGERLAAAVTLRPDAAAPERAVLRLVSDVGMDLDRLFAGLTAAGLGARELLRLRLDDLVMEVASQSGTIGGEAYTQGLSLRAAIDLWGFRAALAGRVDYTQGGSLRGAMSPLRFPSDPWLLDVHGAGDEGPSIAIELTSERKAARVVAAARLVGVYDQSLDVSLEPEALRVELTRTRMGIYAGGRLEIRDGKLTLGCEARFDHALDVPLGRHTIHVALDVGGRLDASGTTSAVRQDLRFDFAACGATMQVVQPRVTIAFTDIESLQRFFAAKCADRVREMIREALRAASLAAITWLTGLLPGPTQVAAALRDCGALCEPVAAGLHSACALAANACGAALCAALYAPQAVAPALSQAYALSERDVGVLLEQIGMSANDIATALHKGFDWSAEKTAKYFDDTLHFGDKTTQKALAAADYSSKQIEDAMHDVFGWSRDLWETVTGIF